MSSSTRSSNKSEIAPKAAQEYTHFLVLDFEANCVEKGKLSPQEIIEIPVVVVQADTLTIVDEFHHYIKPQVHQITPFATQLTG